MKFFKINVLLHALATGVTAYLVYHHYQILNATGSFHSFCSISKAVDCDLVNASRYSEYFGIPIATLGLIYSLFAFCINVYAVRNRFVHREVLALALPLGFFALLASGINLYLSLHVLKVVCVFCLSHQALCLLTFIATALAARETPSFFSFQRKMVLQLAIAGGLLGALVLILSSQLENRPPFDGDEFLSEYRSQTVKNVPLEDSPKMGLSEGSMNRPDLEIVEFADFECGFCGMAARHIHRLAKMYSDKIRVTYKNFPLSSECNPALTVSMHHNACIAAKASVCAQMQGKYVEVSEQLFELQKDLNPKVVRAIALEQGLKMDTFESCMESNQTLQRVRRDAELGKNLGVQSTPTFFVNGKKVQGLIDEQRLRLLLKEARSH